MRLEGEEMALWVAGDKRNIAWKVGGTGGRGGSREGLVEEKLKWGYRSNTQTHALWEAV